MDYSNVAVTVLRIWSDSLMHLVNATCVSIFSILRCPVMYHGSHNPADYEMRWESERWRLGPVGCFAYGCYRFWAAAGGWNMNYWNCNWSMKLLKKPTQRFWPWSRHEAQRQLGTGWSSTLYLPFRLWWCVTHEVWPYACQYSGCSRQRNPQLACVCTGSVSQYVCHRHHTPIRMFMSALKSLQRCAEVCFCARIPVIGHDPGNTACERGVGVGGMCQSSPGSLLRKHQGGERVNWSPLDYNIPTTQFPSHVTPSISPGGRSVWAVVNCRQRIFYF